MKLTKSIVLYVIVPTCFIFGSQSLITPATEGGVGFFYTQAAKPYGQGYLGMNFNMLYNSTKMGDLSDWEHVFIVSSSFTYNLSDDMGFSAALFAIGQGLLYEASGQLDEMKSGLGDARLAFKYHLPLSMDMMDIAFRTQLFIPMGADFAIHPSFPYDTNIYCLELMGLLSFQLSDNLSLHINEGYRLRGLRAEYADKVDLWLTNICFAYPIHRNWLGYSELSSSVELDSKIKPFRDRLVGVQGFRYLTPWGFHFNFAISFRLNDKRMDGTPQRAENWRILLGISLNTRTFHPDDDQDGVPNEKDLEPATPIGYPVDSQGRALDSDLDGVPDGMDKEPQTPKGAKVDRFGQSIDSDNDSVPDGIDEEPNTPTGAVVNPQGIAIDSDGDGVPDGIDIEPNTPAGTQVDLKGKSIPSLEIELLTKGLLRINLIYFDVSKSSIKPVSFGILDEIGRIIENHPELIIQIEGHTDASGSDEFNMQLSNDRANSVKNYLITKFSRINPDKLTTKGFGRTKPVTDNQTKVGKTLNRRVEFKVLNPEQIIK